MATMATPLAGTKWSSGQKVQSSLRSLPSPILRHRRVEAVRPSQLTFPSQSSSFLPPSPSPFHPHPSSLTPLPSRSLPCTTRSSVSPHPSPAYSLPCVDPLSSSFPPFALLQFFTTVAVVVVNFVCGIRRSGSHPPARSLLKLFKSMAGLFAPVPENERAVLLSWGFGRMRISGASAGPLFFAAISGAADSVSSSTPLTVIASGMAKWLELYSGLLLIRVLLSWFPNIDWERQPLQAIRDMSDPYLNLFRNIMPPFFGALDLSPMLAFLVLGMLSSLLNTTIHA